jgi:hypothetical protein
MSASFGGPAVLLLRHAEKAKAGQRNVDEQGHEDPHALSVRGWQRAGAWVRWLAPAEGPAPFGRPQRLFAAAPAPAHPSRRPELSLAPLARALSLPVNTGLDLNDLDAAAAGLLAPAQGSVVACWRHDDLPALARALARRLGCGEAAIPQQWPDEVYDTAWLFERVHDGAWRFGVVAQRLLDGDREHVAP